MFAEYRIRRPYHCCIWPTIMIYMLGGHHTVHQKGILIPFDEEMLVVLEFHGAQPIYMYISSVVHHNSNTTACGFPSISTWGT